MSTIINYITNYFTELFEGVGTEGMIGIGCILIAAVIEFIYPMTYSWGYAHEKHIPSLKIRISACICLVGGIALSLDDEVRNFYSGDSQEGSMIRQFIPAMVIGIMAAIILLLVAVPIVKKLAKHDEETWAKNEKSYWEQHEGEEIHVAQTSREKDLTALNAVNYGLTGKNKQS